MPFVTKARRNSHLTNLAILWFGVCIVIGLLLLLSVLLGSRNPFTDHPDVGLGFILALLAAIGPLTRWAAARISTILVSLAVIFGLIWVIVDTFARNENISIRAFLGRWDTVLIILPGMALGVYGIWVALTQWSTE